MRRDNRRSEPVRRHHDDTSSSFAFRRSRTITGSAATTVRAAGEERGQLRSPRLHEHSLRKHRRKLSLYLLTALSIAGLLWYVVSSYVSGVSVATARTQPIQQTLDTAKYQSLVDAYFDGRPFEKFRFALNEASFERYLITAAPELASASLGSSERFGEATLTLELREPVVAWTIRGEQYFVDAMGVAFTKNYFAVPEVIVADKSGVSNDAGVVASDKLLRFIGRVITLVNQSGVAIVRTVELPTNSTRQVDFRMHGRPYVIKAHLDRDPAGQAADIINALKYIDANQLRPDYLDIRVASKAFYRDAE